MLIKILIVVAVLVCIFVVVVVLQPAAFRITRSATIPAPPAIVFEQVNDLYRWNVWSPWAQMDPNAKNTFEGPPAGVGASFAWVGNSKVGEGRMTITESVPVTRVTMRLEFIKPFTATNATEFTFRPEGEQTAVTWTMTGVNSFMGKAMSLLMNCDKMVGGQFEQGFENLKSVVASKSAPQS